MSKSNPLVGLIGYDDSDDDDDGVPHAPAVVPDASVVAGVPGPMVMPANMYPAIHPAPIPHCMWSACYDEGSGFTYFWNQQTNAVTWEAPPEYLLAVKVAQQHLNTAGSTEVSAEEWQLYQQALAEKQMSQNKVIAKTPVSKPAKKPGNGKPAVGFKDNKVSNTKKRPASDCEDEKIELITSYYNSDSESNDESESPVKTTAPAPKPVTATKPLKHPPKKQKTKPSVMEYGPSLPVNQDYTIPIGPELPPGIINEVRCSTPEIVETAVSPKKEDKKKKDDDSEDSQEESLLLIKLKDKAKLLEKLGGEIPTELQKIIQDAPPSNASSPKVDETSADKPLDSNIDDLLEEIEKKELPKLTKSKEKLDIFSDEAIYKSTENSARNSPRSNDGMTPPREELKLLFPSVTTMIEEPEKTVGLFPSAANIIQENGTEPNSNPETTVLVTEKKATNIYLMDTSEIEKVGRKKLRISNSVLPERKKSDIPSYTTKYSQYIEGFSSERTGLGFTKEEDSGSSPKNTVNYGNGLSFTKGETLNEDKKDEALDDLTDLVEAKLMFLNQLQPCMVTPVQEMLIQMQTLVSAFRAGALAAAYWRRWADAAALSLAQHEAGAAPPGWTCAFQRSEGRYRYRRLADGLVQFEYPAVGSTDMEICTTPPHPGPPSAPDPSLQKEEPLLNPPLPPSPPPPPPPAAPYSVPPPPPPAWSRVATPPPAWARVATPPPPLWSDPPPPGCDDPPPLPPEQPKKQEIGDELLSFYNDIAELEKQADPPPSGRDSPATPPPPVPAAPPTHPPRETKQREKQKTKERAREKEKEATKEEKTSKKKSKMKISSSMGMKQKTVSTLVAKWQQVADEINSD